jgi:hypothetical protein
MEMRQLFDSPSASQDSASDQQDWASIINNNVLGLAFLLMVLTFVSSSLSYAANKLEHVRKEVPLY